MANDLPLLGLSEAAALTGLARQAVRARARRGLIPARKGNDGRIVVQIPAGLSAEAGQDEARLVTELAAEEADLREALARSVAEGDAAMALRLAEVAAKAELIE